MRSTLKRGAEAVLRRTRPAWWVRRRFRAQALILAYHNVLPDRVQPAGDRSLHLARERFAKQLDLLVRTHHVVPLAEIMAPESGRELTRPRAAITFDDAYRGAVQCGVEELVRRKLPATIFVAPALLGRASFWWDALAGEDGTGLARELRDQAMQGHCGQEEAIRRWAEQANLEMRPLGGPFAPATEEELRVAASNEGISVGSHTWSHPNLLRLGDAEVEEELSRSLAWLRERFGAVIPWLSYPYGLADARIQRCAARAGYVAAVLVHGGWMIGRDFVPHALPRLNIPAGLSSDGFACRLSGLLCGR